MGIWLQYCAFGMRADRQDRAARHAQEFQKVEVRQLTDRFRAERKAAGAPLLLD